MKTELKEWELIESAPKNAEAIIAFNGEKVGEAYFQDRDENQKMLGYVPAWYWANDSCDCCHSPADPQPILWMRMPVAPTEF